MRIATNTDHDRAGFTIRARPLVVVFGIACVSCVALRVLIPLVGKGTLSLDGIVIYDVARDDHGLYLHYWSGHHDPIWYTEEGIDVRQRGSVVELRFVIYNHALPWCAPAIKPNWVNGRPRCFIPLDRSIRRIIASDIWGGRAVLWPLKWKRPLPYGGVDLQQLNDEPLVDARGVPLCRADVKPAWRRDAYQPIVKLRLRPDIRILSAAFSDSGEYFAAGSSKGTVALWALSSFELVRSDDDHAHAVVDVQWEPKGLRYLTISRDGLCVVHALDEPAPIRSMIILDEGDLAYAFDPGAVQLVMAKSDGKLYAWKPFEKKADGNDVRLIETLSWSSDDDEWTSLAYGAGGWRAAGTRAGVLLLYRGDNAARVLPTSHREQIRTVALDVQHNVLVSATSGQVRVWDATAGSVVLTIGGFGGEEPRHLALNDRGSWLVFGTEHGTYLFEVANGRLLWSAEHPFLACTADMNMLATGGSNGEITLWRRSGHGCDSSKLSKP